METRQTTCLSRSRCWLGLKATNCAIGDGNRFSSDCGADGAMEDTFAILVNRLAQCGEKTKG